MARFLRKTTGAGGVAADKHGRRFPAGRRTISRTAASRGGRRGLERIWTATWLGWALALASTLSSSIAPAIARATIQVGMDPTTFLMLRMISALVMLGGTLAVIKADRLKIGRRGLFLATGTGIINGIGFLSYFKSLAIIEASVGSMIFSLSPLAVLGLLALRGERLTRRHWGRLALGLGGVYLLVGPSSQVDVAGVLMVLLAVVTFAAHLVLIQWFLKDYHAQSVTFYVILGIAISATAGWLLEGGAWRAPRQGEWAAIIVLAVVSTYLARLTLFGAVRLLGSGQIALLAPLDTLLSVFWAVALLDERFTTVQLVGGLAIMASMLLAVQRLGQTPRRPRWRLWSRL